MNTLFALFLTASLLFQPVELYVIPRNEFTGYADFGLFKYQLYGASLKEPYAKRRYVVRVPRDSVYVLFHAKVSMPDDLQLTGELLPNDNIQAKKIMMVMGMDTMYIDRHYKLKKGNECYKVSDEGRNWLEHQMPEELNDSWKNNLPAYQKNMELP